MTKSDQLVQDFYKGQARRYKLLAIGLALVIVLNVVGLFYLRAEQRKSNDNLNTIATTLSGYVTGYQDRADQRSKELQEQHDKLYKAIVCLVALHDSQQLSEAAESECRSAADEVGQMNSQLQTNNPQDNNLPLVPEAVENALNRLPLIGGL